MHVRVLCGRECGPHVSHCYLFNNGALFFVSAASENSRSFSGDSTFHVLLELHSYRPVWGAILISVWAQVGAIQIRYIMHGKIVSICFRKCNDFSRIKFIFSYNSSGKVSLITCR